MFSLNIANGRESESTRMFRPVHQLAASVGRQTQTTLRDQIRHIWLHPVCFWFFLYFYFAPVRMRSTAICRSVCLFAYRKNRMPDFIKFLYMLPVARSFSGDSAIRYVLPVLWMTSYFHMIEWMGHNERWRACFIQFASCPHRSKVFRLRLHLFQLCCHPVDWGDYASDFTSTLSIIWYCIKT